LEKELKEDNKEETASGQCPNSKYKLSYPNNAKPAEEGLTFYYNRERRLESAPDAVKNAYNENRKIGFGLLRTLVADRPRKILFFIIIMMCVVIWGLSFLGFFDTFHTLDGNRLDITGLNFENMTIVIINKTIRNQGAYTGLVDIAVSTPMHSENDEYPVFYHRVFFTLEREEQYRFVVPFEADELLMVLQSENSTLRLRLKTE
jgi:hypothetical protein